MFVIIARVVRRQNGPLLSHRADEVDMRVVEDLLAFVGSKHIAEILEHLLGLSWFGFGFCHYSITRTIALTARRRALLLLRWWTVTRHFG